MGTLRILRAGGLQDLGLAFRLGPSPRGCRATYFIGATIGTCRVTSNDVRFP